MPVTIEVALLISGVSVAFGLYSGISNLKRNERKDAQSEASEMTTVIVKLETIGTGITEIKSELASVKMDVKEYRERLIRCEESTKQAHKRIDTCEQHYKRGYADAEV
jgi:outer membrane murein-binding lipoprotein Lpp